jgi:dihydroorotase
VHCRDENLSHKETIEHALSVAERVGLSAIFDMPNNSPVTNSRTNLLNRLAIAEKACSPVFYGIYGGITSDEKKILEVVKAHRELFPRVIGLKMFAGHSVGNLGIINTKEQQKVYEILADESYSGVLVVHCEKEELLRGGLFEPKCPASHSYSRPPIGEFISVQEQIKFAKEAHFKGTLHIAHVSCPESVYLVDQARNSSNLNITCGITPHHCLLDYEQIPESEEGLLYKVNPPLRGYEKRKVMLDLLHSGKIDWIETDHAPHTLAEKLGKVKDAKGKPSYMSGFPGLPFYPYFIDWLKADGFSESQIKSLTHDNICKAFKINIPEREVVADKALHSEYEVDVYKNLRK